MAASGTDVHVVWEDERDGNQEIYYKRSTDDGVSWGSDTRLTNSADSSSCPSVAVTGTAVHVFWSDKRNGNFEPYHKRGYARDVSCAGWRRRPARWIQRRHHAGLLGVHYGPTTETYRFGCASAPGTSGLRR